MAVGIQAFSTTAASNGNADTNINFAENQAPSTLNDSARALMAVLKAFYLSLGGGITYGGSSNAYTATNNAVNTWASYLTGSIIALKANHTNNAAATINVDGLGAKDIKTADGGALVSGDLVSGGIYLLAYDGTNFQVLNTIAGGSFQPLDATLTALAGVTVAADQIIYATGADAFSTFTTTSPGRAFLNYADPGADRGIFWDESANALTNFTLGTGLTFNGTALELDAQLVDVAGLTPTDNGVIIGNGTNFVVESGATLRTSLGVPSIAGDTFTGDVILPTAGPTSTLSAGFRGAPINAQNGNYTFVLADAGKHVSHDTGTADTYTIPANASVAFPIGTVIVIINRAGSGNITLAITSDTLRRGDGAAGTGSRTIPASAVATIIKTASTEWYISGVFT